MITLFYGTLLAATLICSIIYFYIWDKHYNVNVGMIFMFIPIACLGHFLFSISRDLGEAITAQKLTYLGGSYLQLFILMSLMNLCQIHVRRWFRTVMLLVCTVTFSWALTIGHSDRFYRDMSFEIVDGNVVLTRSYGWMHTAYYAVVIAFFVVGFIVIGYSWVKKRQVPRTIIFLLVLPYITVILGYFGGRMISDRLDLMPLGYLLAQIIYIVVSTRMNLYDIADTVVDSMVREREIGYISFDFGYRYLGSNETARKLLPELEKLAVDDVVGKHPEEKKILHYLDSFKENPDNNLFTYTLHSEDGDAEKDRIYNVNVNYLYGGKTRHGYLITFTDDTANRKYIQLLDNYNDELQSQVEEKTQHIVEMHDNLVMSLAMMVESRDNSTGGHIKRTSEGVRILVDEISKEGKIDLNPSFCEDIIKAAPMHDLGKIAVDDAVLRKPGRFTPEEYEKMKVHAAEGARVIHEILLHTDDNSFKKVAENIAHYHHERWDGSGYPEKLSGEQIPLEARIMAIADVYDALVSKRVYKEAYDFEKANAIIMEGMGTQFDPSLRVAYENARPRLEQYYKELNI